MDRMKLKWAFVVVVLLVLLVLPLDMDAQCAMCQANVKTAMQNKEGNVVGTGLNNGILFLLAAPYVLIGTVLIIWRTKSKKQVLQLESNG